MPDLSGYTPYRAADCVTLEGTEIPGLAGEWFRREEGGRTATVGLYRTPEREVFMAWGYADETHCAFTSYRTPDGWTPPQPGCPDIPRVVALSQ